MDYSSVNAVHGPSEPISEVGFVAQIQENENKNINSTTLEVDARNPVSYQNHPSGRIFNEFSSDGSSSNLRMHPVQELSTDMVKNSYLDADSPYFPFCFPTTARSYYRKDDTKMGTKPIYKRRVSRLDL